MTEVILLREPSFCSSLVSRDCSDDPKTGGLGSFREMAKKIKKTLRSSKYNLQEKIWVRLFSLEII